MISVKRFSSITEIDQSLWDSILTPHDFFNEYQFIKAVEKARVENASFWYVLFFNDHELIGHSVLSCFSISLDLFIPGSKVAQWIKRAWPDFFNVKILFSGLPVSLAQLNLKISEASWEEEITKALASQMEALAAREKVNLLCVKEFKDDEASRCKALIQQDYFKAFSLPYMTLQVRWNSFSEYISDLRHHYRRDIKLSLKKLNATEPIIHSSTTHHLDDLRPVLILGDITICPPEQMHSLYLSVMNRTPTKLETLNLAFFEQLYVQVGHRLEILTIQLAGKIVCAALLMQVADEITFLLVGREGLKDKFDSYFNLVYGIIQLGIQRKVKKINLGQTAYWVKQRVGAKPVPVYIYFKSRRYLVNLLLKMVNPLIFPNLLLNSLDVFHKTDVIPSFAMAKERTK